MPILDKVLIYNAFKKHKSKLKNAGYIPNENHNVNISQKKFYELFPTHQHVQLECVCDFCNKKFNITCEKLRRSQGKSTAPTEQKGYYDNLTLCRKCRSKLTNNKKYNCNWPLQNETIRAKAKQTVLNKYNYEYITQSPEIKDKIKQTNLQKYGVEYALQDTNIKNKSIYTVRQKYGQQYTNTGQVPIIREKILNTLKLHYNITQSITSPFQIPIIRKKALQTMRANKIATSKQQLYFYQLLKKLVRKKIQLNYPFYQFSLDIAFVKDKIAIEYNGGGHNLIIKFGKLTPDEFIKKEQAREQFLINKNWKIIYIISPKDKIKNYTNNEYLKMIYIAKMYLLNTTHHWVKIYIEKNKFETSVYQQTITNILNI